MGSAAVCAKLEEFARKFNSPVFTPCAYIKARAASNAPLVRWLILIPLGWGRTRGSASDGCGFVRARRARLPLPPPLLLLLHRVASVTTTL
jgi:hypothetical protein